MRTIRSSSAEETRRLGEMLGRVAQPGGVVLLSGDLGAGKTQFSKGVAVGLGIEEPVTSPTFNILLVHEGASMPLYHFDLYRLEHESELEDIDYYATLEDDGLSLVEWGDRFPRAIPSDVLKIELAICGESARLVHVQAVGPRSMRLEAAWLDAMGATS